MNGQLKLTVKTNFVRIEYDRIREVTHYIRDQLGQILVKVTKPLVFMDLSCACYKVLMVFRWASDTKYLFTPGSSIKNSISIHP